MANVETVRIMMTRDGPLSHQRKGLVLDARIGVGRDDKPVYWIHWAGNALAVDASECVRLNGGRDAAITRKIKGGSHELH